MASQEELDLLRSNLGKIRYTYNDEGQKIVFTRSEDAIQIVLEKFDVIKDNFQYFITSPNSIMYPDEFIFAIPQFPDGKKLLLDNIDYLMQRNNYKRNVMAEALENIDGIEQIFLKDFQNRFNLFTKGKYESDQDIFNEENFYPKHDMANRDEYFRILSFLRIVCKGKNISNIFETNKTLFLSPRYNAIMPDIILLLLSKPELHDFLRNNFDRIIKCSKEEDVIKIYKTLKDICPREYEEEGFVIEQIYDKAMEQIEAKKTQISDDDIELLTKQVSRTCGRIVAQRKSRDFESIINVASRGDEIEICGIGAFSTVLKVGGKVFKLGGDRIPGSQFKIQNHPRLLRPIIRKKDVSTLENHPIYFEIQDEVDTDIEVTDEELLQIYKELREAGIIWCDAKKNNLGRLKDDNCGYPIGYGVPSNNQSLGLIGEDTFGSSLKKGDLVVIDLDLLYPVDCLEAQFTEAVPEFIREYEAKISKQEQAKETR